MRKINIVTVLTNIILLLVVVFSSSCNKQLMTGNGGFSDVSLSRNSSEYQIKRLKTIKVEGSSFWGIPSHKNNPNKNNRGMIVRFNGLDLGSTPQFLPIVTMVGYSFGLGSLINSAFGQDNGSYNSSTYTYTSAKDKLGIVPSTLLAIPLAGIINNWTWNGIAVSGTSNELNYQLVTNNPTVDVFFNPKFKIKYNIGWWKQTAVVEADVMGATIKADQ